MILLAVLQKQKWLCWYFNQQKNWYIIKVTIKTARKIVAKRLMKKCFFAFLFPLTSHIYIVANRMKCCACDALWILCSETLMWRIKAHIRIWLFGILVNTIMKFKFILRRDKTFLVFIIIKYYLAFAVRMCTLCKSTIDVNDNASK